MHTYTWNILDSTYGSKDLLDPNSAPIRKSRSVASLHWTLWTRVQSKFYIRLNSSLICSFSFVFSSPVVSLARPAAEYGANATCRARLAASPYWAERHILVWAHPNIPEEASARAARMRGSISLYQGWVPIKLIIFRIYSYTSIYILVYILYI